MKRRHLADFSTASGLTHRFRPPGVGRDWSASPGALHPESTGLKLETHHPSAAWEISCQRCRRHPARCNTPLLPMAPNFQSFDRQERVPPPPHNIAISGTFLSTELIKPNPPAFSPVRRHVTYAGVKTASNFRQALTGLD
jgi:hypothetical protein